MISKTKLPSHSLHPVLTGFPALFYTGTFACLCAYYFTGNRTWFTISYFSNITAIATAILAALPGFIDWLNIPSVKKTRFAGAQQIALNAIALVLVSINLYIQNDSIYFEKPDAQPGITLSGVACFFLITAMIFSKRIHHVSHSINFNEQKQHLGTTN
jgi:uncharacterized membrane protein